MESLGARGAAHPGATFCTSLDLHDQSHAFLICAELLIWIDVTMDSTCHKWHPILH